MRACVEPDAYRAAIAALEHYDVSALLPKVAAPTLVVQNQKGPSTPVQAGQRLAASIANSRFLVVEDPAWAQLPALIDEFLSEGEEPAVAPAEPPALGAFRTVLFTDVAGSTSMMQRLGDARGRAVLREHERITRQALKAHGGTEVKTMGDGFMACFSSATGALECAIALQRAFAEWNADVGAALAPPQGAASSAPTEAVRIRIGLNAGEPIAEEQDLFGTAVILAARIAAKGEGGEIVVSDTVRGLVAGKGFLFSDRGDVVLRGFEDPVRLYEVRWREDA
jgi:class 3 adenylate cyclase